MADSIVEIVNTTLTSTELPDSATELTLITTDANTSYVIKDVQLNTYGKTLLPKINGTSIGEWISSLSGSEVIDVSSTLKVTSTNMQYEDDFEVLELTEYPNYFSSGSIASSNVTTQTNIALFNHENVLERQSKTDVSQFANILIQNSADVKTWQKVYGDVLYVVTADADGNFRVDKYDSKLDGRTTVKSGSELAWPDPANDKIWYEDANALKYIDLTTGSTTTVRSNFMGSHVPNAYAKSGLNGDWVFLLSPAQQLIFGYNTETDITVLFGVGGFSTTLTDDSDFCVSYDKSEDIFVFYFQEINAIYCAQSDVTRTTMNAYTSDQTGLTTTARSNGTASMLEDWDTSSQGLANSMVGSLSVGTVFYYKSTNSAIFKATQISNTTTATKIAEVGQWLYGGNSSNFNAWMVHYHPNSVQAKEYGLLEYCNKANLRITGVKTTT